MYPVLLEYGPIVIFSLWFFIAVGFFVSGFLFIKLAIYKRYRLNFILEHFLGLLLYGLILGRLIYVLRNLDIYFEQGFLKGLPQALAIWDKGISFWGVVLGISAGLYIKGRKHEESTDKWFDLLVISLLAGMVFGNIGAFLEGINYGKETSLPWGVTFESIFIQYTVPIHPVQLYAALYTLILAITGITLLAKKVFKIDGTLALLGTFFYGLFRFFEESVRGDETLVFLNLREGHWLGIFLMLLAGIFLILRYNKFKSLTKTP